MFVTTTGRTVAQRSGIISVTSYAVFATLLLIGSIYFAGAANAEVNTAPSFDAIADQTVDEDSSSRDISITGVSDPESQAVTMSAGSSNTALIPNPAITGEGATRTLTYTPAADANGSAAITVTADDGQSSNNTFIRTFTITVNSVNDVPSFDAISNQSVVENSSQQSVNITNVSPGPSDESGQTVTMSATSDNTTLVPNPNNSAVSSGSATLTYTPAANQTGTAVITVTADDGQASNNTTPRTFTITVNEDVTYVDDSATGANDGSSPANAFTTIQAAISAVASGATIDVAAGTYAENVSINSKTDLIIRGVGVTTIIEPASGIGFAITNSSDITIKDLKIHTAGTDAHGIWVAGTPSGGSAVDGLTVKSTTIVVDGYSAGIYAEQVNPAHTNWQIGGTGDENAITINDGTGGTGDGLDLHDVSASTVSYNNITLNNPVSSTNVLWTSELSNLSGLTFSNNTVSGSSGSEVAFVPNFVLGGGSTITTITVSGNTFQDWGSRALRMGDKVSSATVSGNKFLVAEVSEILKNENASAEVNAEGNWWGYSTGPASSATVGTVDYRPWCTENTCATVDNAAPTAAITYSDSDGIVKSGDTLTITATFSEAILDSPVVKISISGSNSVSATEMTKVDSTHYTYIHTVGTGDGTASVALSVGTDASGNIITSAPTSGATFTVDNTAPDAPSTPDLNATSDSGSSDSDDITNSTTPTLTLTAESGSSIKIYDTDGTTIIGLGDPTTGTYIIGVSTLSPGVHSVTAKATDVAGEERGAFFFLGGQIVFE